MSMDLPVIEDFSGNPCSLDAWGISDKSDDGCEEKGLSEDWMTTGYTSGQKSLVDLSLESNKSDDDHKESKIAEALIQMSHLKGDESPLNSSLESCNSQDEWDEEVLFEGKSHQNSCLIEENSIISPQVDNNNKWYFELITTKLNYSYGDKINFDHLKNHYSSGDLLSERDDTEYFFI
ncbi:hypothetical protein ID47_05590 [Candidatus Paracaedibacter acanthamoebae]|uniref:Uncharacterized protein n=2 Tax=Candidatus Odyssella acanthamoebae TaxID=91604 RepID=A0A077AW91_9PROT|nr:hypothetical protein ID47_05590 [Candidatus Paracaedibacter acanthamoebae]